MSSGSLRAQRLTGIAVLQWTRGSVDREHAQPLDLGDRGRAVRDPAGMMVRIQVVR